jgi:hypothetical protein
MNYSVKYEGDWWLPENPDKKIKGVLEFNGNMISLKLEGSFFQNEEVQIIGRPSETVPIILGETKDKTERFTLYKVNLFGDIISGYQGNPMIIFKGKHFPKEEDIKFKKILCDFSHIGKFLISEKFPKVKKLKDEVEVLYKIPPERIINIEPICTIKIKFACKLQRHFTPFSEIKIIDDCFFEIDFPEEKDIWDTLKTLSILDYFLSFITDTVIHPLEIKGNTKENNLERENGINIYYKTSVLGTTAIKENPGISIILPKIDTFLRNWLTEANYLLPVFNLYFRILDSSHSFSDYDYFIIISALESYHRRMYKGEWVEKEKYDEFIDKLSKIIPQDVNSDFIKKWKDRIKYAYEYSLRDRVKELLEKYSEIFGEIILDEKKFINCVVETRNFFVHLSETNNCVLEGEKLYWGFIALKMLMEVCFLDEIGKYSKEEIKYFLEIKYSYQISEIKKTLFE